MTLDRTRPYGEIFGSTDGAKYEQDGKQFDSFGNLLTKDSIVSEFYPVGARQEIVEPKKRGRPAKK